MAEQDQKWRKIVTKTDNKKIDSISVNEARKKVQQTDSSNYVIIKQIFETYDFPGFNIIGEESSHNFWILVQHSDKYPDFQEKVLLKMKEQVDKQNANASDYAYLVDRVKVNTGQLQIYGTQMILNSDKTSYMPKPVIDPEKLNERRKSIGLPTIEFYIKAMNDNYPGDLKNK